MKLSSLVDGISILRPYFKDPDGYHVGAEHDQIFVYATDRPVSEEDRAKLVDLGWFQPDQEEDEPYDPGQGWSAFT